MSAKEWLGSSVGPYEEDVTAERIRDFSAAIGAGGGGDAPPTFLTLFRNGERELFEKLGVALSSVLHAEQEFSLASRIQAGDRLVFSTTLSRALEKRGSSGLLRFLTFETEFRARRGVETRELGRSSTLIVVRASA